jgi:uncharacterized protein (TIGR00725 family)
MFDDYMTYFYQKHCTKQLRFAYKKKVSIETPISLVSGGSMKRRSIIAVVGDSVIVPGDNKHETAFAAGRALVDNGYRVQSGGLNGIMDAAFEGAKTSPKCDGSDTIAIIPSFNRTLASEYADIIIPTGLDMYRNGIVANAEAIIAIGGGAGTLSEMAFGWSLLKLIIAFDNVEGWSKKLAGTRMDYRKRYDFEDDRVFAVSTAEEMIKVLNEKLPLYNKFFDRIVE